MSGSFGYHIINSTFKMMEWCKCGWGSETDFDCDVCVEDEAAAELLLLEEWRCAWVFDFGFASTVAMISKYKVSTFSAGTAKGNLSSPSSSDDTSSTSEDLSSTGCGYARVTSACCSCDWLVMRNDSPPRFFEQPVLDLDHWERVVAPFLQRYVPRYYSDIPWADSLVMFSKMVSAISPSNSSYM